MNADCLKLTTYVGERKRVGDRFVADALLDLYGRHGVATSVLLRGAAGFGRKHHLRTDSSLTLSEDLPAVTVAVDERARIEALLDDAVRLSGGGLVTLERARLAVGELTSVALPAELAAATKLTIYLGRQQRVGGVPAHLAVCRLLRERGIDGATVLLGVDGTAHGQRARARFFAANADVPVMVIAVGSGELIADVLAELGTLLPRPLITLERVQICKRDGQLLTAPHALPATDEHGLPVWQKLMVYTSEGQLQDGRPIHRAITRRLRERGAAGVTTVRGIWGFSGSGEPHGDRLLQLGRRVPTVTITVDSPERAAESFLVVDELTAEHGLVTSELVPALRVEPGDALRMARHRY